MDRRFQPFALEAPRSVLPPRMHSSTGELQYVQELCLHVGSQPILGVSILFRSSIVHAYIKDAHWPQISNIPVGRPSSAYIPRIGVMALRVNSLHRLRRVTLRIITSNVDLVWRTRLERPSWNRVSDIAVVDINALLDIIHLSSSPEAITSSWYVILPFPPNVLT